MANLTEQLIKISKLSKRKPKKSQANTNLGVPVRLENKLQSLLNGVILYAGKQIREILIPQLESLNKEYQLSMPSKNRDSITHNDITVAEKLAQLTGAITVNINGHISSKDIEKQIEAIGYELSDHNRDKIAKAFKKVLGISLFQEEPFLQEVISNYRLQTVRLIKNAATENFIADVDRIVLSGFENGLRHEEIAKQLTGYSKGPNGKVSRLRYNKNRSKVIARDQMNKLNGKLTQERQTNAGLNQYIWVTVGDDRVRPSHAAKNGKKFSWDKPPKDTGHPGEDIMCRCYADPVFDI